MHRLCNLFRLYLEQQYFVFKTKNKASFSQGDFNVVTPAFVESLIFANSSQGRRRVCKSGGLGSSNVVDIICPPCGIGLTDLPKSGWAQSAPPPLDSYGPTSFSRRSCGNFSHLKKNVNIWPSLTNLKIKLLKSTRCIILGLKKAVYI